MLRRFSLCKALAIAILPFLLLSGISCSQGEGVENEEDNSVPVELAAVVDTSISSYVTDTPLHRIAVCAIRLKPAQHGTSIRTTVKRLSPFNFKISVSFPAYNSVSSSFGHPIANTFPRIK